MERTRTIIIGRTTKGEAVEITMRLTETEHGPALAITYIEDVPEARTLESDMAEDRH